MNLFFTIKEWLIFQIKSKFCGIPTNDKNMLKSVSFCLDKKDIFILNSINKLKQKLKKSTEIIEFTDYGSGNKMVKTKKVSEIAQKSVITKHKAHLLYSLSKHFKTQNILELGTSLGISTILLAKSTKYNKILTIDGCKDVGEIAKENFADLQLTNIQQITANIDVELIRIFNKNQDIDFIYFDANHTKEATLKYFYTSIDFTNTNGVFIFDDLYYSQGMKEAWNEIKQNSGIKFWADLFYLGVVVVR